MSLKEVWMLEISYATAFKKQYKKLNSADKELTKEIIKKLANEDKLEIKHQDHNLKGKYKDFRECHIKPDLLLIYKINKDILELYLSAVGSHTDLLGL